MSNVEMALAYVLPREGGLRKSANDPGGITNFGISLRFLRSLPIERLHKYGIFNPVTEDTIRELTIDQAKRIYVEEFWKQGKFDEIKEQTLCNYIFDMCVNLGMGQAITLVQRGIASAMLVRNYVKVDGILGKETVAALNHIDVLKLISVLVAMRTSFYRLLVNQDPKKNSDLNGWLNRAYNVA